MYVEIKFKTTSEASELAAEAMWTAGADGVEIDDANDFLEAVRDPMNWDYADENDVVSDGTADIKAVFTGVSLVAAEKAAREALLSYLGSVPGGFEVATREDEDWENGWKSFYKPAKIGEFEIVPVWMKDEYPAGEKTIYINPATAFGTGEHPSTRLALLLMSGLSHGKSVVDIGTGSGILGIAAAKAGAKRVLMTDFDPEAVNAAHELSALNGVAEAEIRLGDLADGVAEKFDVVTANLTADILPRLAPDIKKITNPGAKLILSGILTKRADEVIEAFVSEGMDLDERAEEGEWTALKMTRKPIACVFNYGCKTNQYECDVLAAKLEKKGYAVTEKMAFADKYFINTCAVTREAERKSRQSLSRARGFNKDAEIYILGCAAEKDPDRFIAKKADHVSGTGGKYRAADIEPGSGSTVVKNYPINEFEYPDTLPMVSRTRALVKIEDGCDNFCSYCVIPYLRGRARSRTTLDAAEEILALSQKAKEVVVTGINLEAFGRERGESLTDLMKAVNGVKCRIRLGSLYAGVIDDDFLMALQGIEKFCPHFHLSLQSGSDRVLAAMNRHYTVRGYLEKIALIRKYFPLAAVTTDIIVGFPGETEEDFRDTLRLADEARFADIHIFPFSPREGTAAYKMPRVKREKVAEREKRLAVKRGELRREYLEKMLEVPQKVLFEHVENNLSTGYSEYYIKFYVKTDIEYGIIKPLSIYKDGLTGEIVK